VIDFPGARATLVARVNAQGQTVGAYSEEANAVATDLPHGFLLKDGVFTRIDVPGARRTQPFGINNNGQIVGAYVDAEGRSHGFLLDNGVFTTIDAPDDAATIAFDIDDSGRIVGISGSGGAATRGFLRAPDGAFTPIEVPDGAQTYAFGINNRAKYSTEAASHASTPIFPARREPRSPAPTMPGRWWVSAARRRIARSWPPQSPRRRPSCSWASAPSALPWPAPRRGSS
jgi:probable HAF family extracellular repeat protein